MRLKAIVPEDCNHYKDVAMVLFTCFCDFKCCIDQGKDFSMCQNYSWANNNIKDYNPQEIVGEYFVNPFSHALVFAGLEPFLQFTEMLEVIEEFRKFCEDPIIIYTGYNEEEIENYLLQLRKYGDIIVKFGRYIPNQEKHKDTILGVTLASMNQYAKKINE